MYYGIIIGMIIIIMNMHKEYVFYEYLCKKLASIQLTLIFFTFPAWLLKLDKTNVI